jgi:molybdenum cofactor biosynthesis enzyme MoaA
MEANTKRLAYLMNDFVVQEHVCNLRCSYCLNFENENLKGGQPWVPIERINLKPDSRGWQRARQVLEVCRKKGDAPILRLAGGEIMAIPGGVDFVRSVAPHWHRVQVLTNATFLRRDIDELAPIPNLNLCCSVDGHTAELNALRTPNVAWANRIIDGFRAAVEAGIPVEVYTVLTHHNTEALFDFVSWVADLPRRADVRILAFPVRGEVAKETAPRAHQLHSIEKLLDRYDEFAAVLPPRAYYERMLSFCRTGRRSFGCRVPLSFVQTFDDGVVASCSNCWASPLGNLLENDCVFEQVGVATIHKLFLRNPPRFPFCRTCFTPFDVVNVYADGACALAELAQMDLYSSAPVQRRLAELRAGWSGGQAQALWQIASEPAGIVPGVVPGIVQGDVLC